MLTTTLPLHTVRSNAGTTAIIATLSDGTQSLVGESDSLGRKRAMMDVLRAGNGSAIAKNLARLEKRERAIMDAQDKIGRTLLCSAGCTDPDCNLSI